MNLSAGLVRVNRSYLLDKFSRPKGNEAIIPVGVTNPVPVPASLVARWLQHVPAGNYKLGHLPWSPPAGQLLDRLQFKHIIIIRDPRAVLVSFLRYIARRRHPLHNTFRRLSEREQIALLLTGRETPDAEPKIQPIPHWYRDILAWHEKGQAHLVRFENLIGSSGRGEDETQRQTVRELVTYLALDPTETLIDHVCNHIYDPQSPTFRTGQINSWREELPPAQITLLNQNFDPLLQQLGYQC